MAAQQPGEPKAERDPSALMRLATLLRPYKWALLMALAMLMGLTATNVAVPQLIGRVFDIFEGDGGNFGVLWFILGGMLGLYVLRNLLYFHSKFTTVRVGENVCFKLRNQLFDRLQQMNLHYYRRTQPGQLSSRVMNDSHVIQEFIQSEVPKLSTALLLFLGVAATMYAMNWQLALAATIVLPLHMAAFHYFKGPIKQASRSAQQHLAEAQGNLIEKFLGIEVVKGFTGEDRENRAFAHATDLSRQSQLQSQKYHVMQKVAADLLIGLGTVFLIGFGAIQVLGGRLDAGAFVTFFIYVGMLYPTVLELMSGFAKLTKATACLDRVFEVLHTPGSESDESGKLRPQIQGAVAFHNVSFRYDEGPPVLEDVSFAIKPGQVCAIVGPSGSGKSTLISLVPRFNDPDAGQILIDGADVHEIDVRHLREAIGIAFQEVFLFNSSVLENLRYAAPEATRSEIVDVATRTGAHEMIVNLPHGYDTLLGDSGVSLSRGQKQQIALTRAMLKNPRILILDEATASIDAARESQIVPSILEFMEGKTTLMITHRPELLKHADLILQMPEGRISYSGEEAAAWLQTGGAERQHTEEPPPRPRRRSKGSSGIWRTTVTLALAAGLALTFSGQALAEEEGDNNGEPEPATEAADPEAVLEAGYFLAQPDRSTLEVGELVEVVAARLRAEKGYRPASEDEFVEMPEPPDRLRGVTSLRRSSGDGVDLIQLGYRPFRSQPPHIWLYGQRQVDGELEPNPDIEDVLTMVDELAEQIEAEELQVADLGTRLMTLSHVEAGRVLGVLQSFGYNTIDYTADGTTAGGGERISPSASVDVNELPIIMSMPGPSSSQMVGGNNIHSHTFPHTSTGPLEQLMILYHPARPEEYAEVRRRIREEIDVAARQILIEAMVLEVSESGMRELGVEWNLTEQFRQRQWDNLESLRLGRSALEGTPTLTATVGRVFGHFEVEIQALIQSGEAEILSRPSILTLDNRQASINVGERIPIVEQIEDLRIDRLQFDTRYEDVGIYLNVRPRVTEDGQEVGMQITGEVSAEVPGRGVELTDQDGRTLVTVPRISERQVQTYSRIANNTPFIIGGLISRDDTVEQRKVPILGDIPVLGALFRHEQVEQQRREVIIVITPFVLPEQQIVGRNIPRDDDLFDSFGNRLFRDAYRIRGEDVFDLAFLTENQQLRRMQRLADRVVTQNPDLRDRYPFGHLADGRIPGEYVLVHRQMYEVGNRQGLDNAFSEDQLIFFHPDEEDEAGFSVTFFDSYLEQVAERAWRERHPDGDFEEEYPEDDFFAALGDMAVAMTFTDHEDIDTDAAEIMRQPVPELRLIDLGGERREWSRRLWELNQPDEDGHQRWTILIQTPRDLRRIRQAAMLKEIVQLNATTDSLRLSNFTIGRTLLMPDVDTDDIFVIDSDTARYFFYTEMYYPVLRQEIQRAMNAVERAMERPEVRDAAEAPDRGGRRGGRENPNLP